MRKCASIHGSNNISENIQEDKRKTKSINLEKMKIDKKYKYVNKKINKLKSTEKNIKSKQIYFYQK